MPNLVSFTCNLKTELNYFTIHKFLLTDLKYIYMTKNIIALLLIVGLFSSCCESTNDGEETNQETAQISAAEIPSVKIGTFDAEAGNYVDQEVKVSGIVDHLCKHGGKKLFMVSDDGDLHVESDERFDEKLSGLDITVFGIVREFRVDEAYCLKMEEDNIQSHKTGETEDDLYESKMGQIQFYRDSMSTAGTDHLSFYSIEYISHEENK